MAQNNNIGVGGSGWLIKWILNMFIHYLMWFLSRTLTAAPNLAFSAAILPCHHPPSIYGSGRSWSIAECGHLCCWTTATSVSYRHRWVRDGWERHTGRTYRKVLCSNRLTCTLHKYGLMCYICVVLVRIRRKLLDGGYYSTSCFEARRIIMSVFVNW